MMRLVPRKKVKLVPDGQALEIYIRLDMRLSTWQAILELRMLASTTPYMTSRISFPVSICLKTTGPRSWAWCWA
eukprot:10455179-Karenia_brevis.AAC.1